MGVNACDAVIGVDCAKGHYKKVISQGCAIVEGYLFALWSNGLDRSLLETMSHRGHLISQI